MPFPSSLKCHIFLASPASFEARLGFWALAAAGARFIKAEAWMKKKARVKSKAPGAAGEALVQYGALPYRVAEDGHLEVMLVTSRETRRWVVPKGWPIRDLKPHSSAEREAYEEAGIVGRVRKRSVGSYTYDKRLNPDTTVLCEVELFPLEVRKQLKRWPEKKQREGRWFALDEAAAVVDERELGDIMRRLDKLVKPPSAPA